MDAQSEEQSTVDQLSNRLTGDNFQAWYRERQHRQNIENGTPYFNGSGHIPKPERHSPSKLLRCHRRVQYQSHNAPAETDPPTGIFWFGTKFETELAVPFLRSLTNNAYIQNSIWVDVAVETEGPTIQIRGETDPVFVNEKGEPLLPTEIKTISSLTNLDSPKEQHLAQVHAYLYGLSKKYDRQVQDGAILYIKRDDFQLKTFQVQFDQEFWKARVLSWIRENTHHRRTETLPAAEPEYAWECNFCPYQRRCGQADDVHSDVGLTGLLPLTPDYPRKQLEEYLIAYPNAKLTPTLAHEFPDLASKYGSYDWRCPVCGTTDPIDSADWNGDTDRPPLCKSCGEDGLCIPLVGPPPRKQAVTRGESDD